MGGWVQGYQKTIGLDCTKRHPVQWYLGKDTSCYNYLEPLIVEIYFSIKKLIAEPWINDTQSHVIIPSLDRFFITADLHALPVVTGIKHNDWRVDRFEQSTLQLAWYFKQSTIFLWQLQHWWDRYDTEKDEIKENADIKRLLYFFFFVLFVYCLVFFIEKDISMRQYQTPVCYKYRKLMPDMGIVGVGMPILHSTMRVLVRFFNWGQLVLVKAENLHPDFQTLLKTIIYGLKNMNKASKKGQVAVSAQEFFQLAQQFSYYVLQQHILKQKKKKIIKNFNKRYCTNMILFMSKEFYAWRHTGYLFGTIIYLLDVGCNGQYDTPGEQNLCLLTGMVLGLLVREQEKYFNSSKFISDTFDEEHCSTTEANYMDAILHIWVFRIITNVNIFYMNELRDEYVIYHLVKMYHLKQQKANLETISQIEVVNMMKEIMSLPTARREWKSDAVRCYLINLRICPCIISLRLGCTVLLQWMDITFSFQIQKNQKIWDSYHFYNTGKIISNLDLPHKDKYFTNLIHVCCCGLSAKKYNQNVNERIISVKDYYLLVCRNLKKICNKKENETNQQFIECKIANFNFLN